MAVFAIQVTGIHTRPAVTPQPSGMSLYAPARKRAVRGVGALPLQKNQRRFTSSLAFIASHEACCRMAVFTMQVTGIHTRPASRGTRRATAVTPQPSRMSLYAPVRKSAARGAGALPLQKNQRRFTSTLAFIASHEACCRMAVFAMQVTGIHTRPASREARCRAAVTPQPSCMSLYAPARIARSPGCRGTAPA